MINSPLCAAVASDDGALAVTEAADTPIALEVVGTADFQFVSSPLTLDDPGSIASDYCAMRVNGERLVARPLAVRAGEPVEITGWMGDGET